MFDNLITGLVAARISVKGRYSLGAFIFKGLRTHGMAYTNSGLVSSIVKEKGISLVQSQRVGKYDYNYEHFLRRKVNAL